MDPLSQAALGAVVAQSITSATLADRRIGYRAAVYGAIVGAMPDIDVLFSIYGDFVDQLLTHRGITHSLFFAPVVGPVLGWLVWRRERRKDPSIASRELRYWIIALTLAIFSHPLLDLMTTYGTQLLLPFSDTRFAINAMPIIDPLYTALLIGGLLLARLWPDKALMHTIALSTLFVSSSYLGYGWWLNRQAEDYANAQLQAAGIENARVSAFPTILQVHYRRVVARLPGRDMVGFISMWQPCDIAWQTAPTADAALLVDYLQSREGRVFDWFTMGWAHYDLKSAGSGWRLLATDLRYGFDTDPLKSVFSVNAQIGVNGLLAGPVSPGRNVPFTERDTLTALLDATYSPVCNPAQDAP
ncbi:MAG: metal-dependent hydrolase [Gammaproteobacteria bacterium]|nr:metal-dependent hydrolase [Gammaproteobacteria bacterium]